LKAVDLFAGWSGFSLGATWAGARVVWAANHNPIAVRVYADNHPGTQVECQDLRQANWSKLPRFDLLLASPACQPHSTASQSQRLPRHDEDRQTAWAIIDCAEVNQPRAIVVENVTAFRRWVLYPLWKQALELLGYTLTELVAHASEHGVPQRRSRLFVIGTRNGRRVSLPLSLAVEAASESCLEPLCPGGWKLIKSAPEDSRNRMLEAQAHTGNRCLVQHVTGHKGILLSEPFHTITTKAQWVLVSGNVYRWITPRELARGQGFPDSFTWPASLSNTVAKIGIGNAVPPPLARDVVSAVMRVAQERRAA
jgi:DNA (cytosine-5)-methyltransferase 1